MISQLLFFTPGKREWHMRAAAGASAALPTISTQTRESALARNLLPFAIARTANPNRSKKRVVMSEVEKPS